MRARAFAVAVLVSLGGCGDDEHDGGTTVVPAEGEHTSDIFEPAFTVVLPEGWKAVERGDDVAQLFEDCPTCTHEGEELGEVTLDMALADESPADAIERVRAAEHVVPGEVEEATIGGEAALHVQLVRTGEGEVRFEDSGYGSDPVGEPIEAYALAVGDRTVTVFVDPHESRGDDATAFYALADGMLETLTFTARPG